jgi:hypothetical protein
MSKFFTVSALLMLTLGLPAGAPQRPTTWPSKEQLRAVQKEAFNCSRENSAEPCDKTRALADPLMDHPLLPGVCKDVVWSLLEQARVSPTNDYKRRDAIDEQARRLTSICAKREKPKKRPPGAPPSGAPGAQS